ncbi:hypothetical protein [Zooshikella ganghwensis]|uniref:hypothetical protein n=1 Tax=Zooshikella ganghwensis TaxID=202772 RepID=UPI0013FD559D|nr:hypothetical protein [Zooshikella ganghwensis]
MMPYSVIIEKVSSSETKKPRCVSEAYLDYIGFYWAVLKFPSLELVEEINSLSISFLRKSFLWSIAWLFYIEDK